MKKNKSMTIDMNDLQLKSLGRRVPEFRTGKYMTEKDRPRKKFSPREKYD